MREHICDFLGDFSLFNDKLQTIWYCLTSKARCLFDLFDTSGVFLFAFRNQICAITLSYGKNPWKPYLIYTLFMQKLKKKLLTALNFSDILLKLCFESHFKTLQRRMCQVLNGADRLLPLRSENNRKRVHELYAVIETGGKQYRVQEGDIIFVEKLGLEEGTEVQFDKIVALNNDKKLTVGTPYVQGASVDARVIKNGRAKKIIVFKFKAKKNYHRKKGHRQDYTKVQIEAIKA